MMIDDQLPDLPKVADNILKVNSMIDHSLLVFKTMAKYKESDHPRKLIGHISDADYVSPADNK